MIFEVWNVNLLHWFHVNCEQSVKLVAATYKAFDVI